jgi:hypothetical protein
MNNILQRPEASRDPDALFDDATVFLIEIRVRRNGNMSVAGDINNTQYALQVLDAAKDSVRRHSNRIAGGVIIPATDMPT